MFLKLHANNEQTIIQNCRLLALEGPSQMIWFTVALFYFQYGNVYCFLVIIKVICACDQQSFKKDMEASRCSRRPEDVASFPHKRTGSEKHNERFECFSWG